MCDDEKKNQETATDTWEGKVGKTSQFSGGEGIRGWEQWGKRLLFFIISLYFYFPSEMWQYGIQTLYSFVWTIFT